MAQSDARFDYRANLGRTDFDLSQKLGLTCAPGMLLPVWFDFASPGDTYYMQHDLPLLRSKNLAAPAMIDVKVHFETFFVPMQMIYQPFEQTMFSLTDMQSNFYAVGNLKNNAFPLFDYTNFVQRIMSSTYVQTDYHADAFRLADLFGLMPDNFVNSAATFQAQYAPSFFPWQLLAYHTIFQYYYRLDDKTNFSHACTNYDSFYSSSSAIVAPLEFMSIHQRPWNFDYFTSSYRSPIASDENLQRLMGYAGYSQLSDVQTTENKTDGGFVNANHDIANFASDPSGSPDQGSLMKAFNTASIRQMFANEKLAMITGRTRKNYDSQVLAHYGVPVPHDVKHDITMVHHDTYDVKVMEVTSTASSNTTALGELAGKSYASGDGREFKFTAPVHGVMMTIMSVEPQKRYISAFDKLNAVTTAFDFPTPEFDRLGNTPMYRYECGFNVSNLTFTMADVVAWKERYYQNKRKYDKCTYAFATGTGRGFNNYSCYMLAERPFGQPADYNDYLQSGISQRPDLEDRYYIERSSIDNLCLVQFVYGWLDVSGGENWNETPWLAYARDPFIVNSFIKSKKVSWMSKDGEPIYNY